MEKTIKIYRIEDCEGNGPYRGHYLGSVLEMHREHFRSDYHTAPSYDFSYPVFQHRASISGIFKPQGPNPEYFYGCSSITLLERWFRGFTSSLEKNKFRIMEYEVPEYDVIVSHSGRQIAFKKDNIINKKELNFNLLHGKK